MTGGTESLSQKWRSTSCHPDTVIQPLMKNWTTKVRELTVFYETTETESMDEHSATDDIKDLLKLKKLHANSREYSQLLDKKPHLRFYMGQREAMKLFHEQMEIHVRNGKTDLAAVLAMASGSLPKLVNLALKYGQRSHLLIAALANSESGSPTKNLYFDHYANSMANEKEFLQATAFYFGCGNTEKAIRSLLDAKCFRDAVLTCRLRLPPNHELYNECISLWASRYTKDRNYEAAARCFISGNDYMAASKEVVTRKTVQSMLLGVQLHLLSDLPQMATAMAKNCIAHCMAECSWNEGMRVIDFCPNLEAWKFVLLMHQALLFTLIRDRINDNVFPYEFEHLPFSSFHNDIKTIKYHDFLHKTWHVFMWHGLKTDQEYVGKLIESLKPSQSVDSVGLTLKTIMAGVSVNMTLGLLNATVDLDESKKLFLKATESVSMFGSSARSFANLTRLQWDIKVRSPCCKMDAILNLVPKPVINVKKEEILDGAIIRDLLDEMCQVVVGIIFEKTGQI